MNTKIFDLETNGLKDTVSKIHCLVIEDYATGVIRSFGENVIPLREPMEPMQVGLKLLADADRIVGHNIIDYDIPVIQKLYPKWSSKAQVRDTIVAAKAIWQNIKETDFALHKKGQLPPNLIGQHKLEAWGHRLKLHKGDYGKTADWQVFDQEMLDYCVLDVKVTSKLWNLIERKGFPELAMETEHHIHKHCLMQTEFGFPFNVDKANKLLAKLQVKKAELNKKIIDELGPAMIISAGEHVSKRTVKYKDVLRGNETAGSHWTKVKVVDFNPNSRSHLTKSMMKKLKWVPKSDEWGKDGIPNLDEEILSALDYPIAKVISENMMIEKRISQLATGEQAWLLVEKEGKIHGRVNTMGAVTARCSHHSPNLAQIPANDAPYGHQCRELFEPHRGWKQFGTDVAGLELRALAHYMFPFDNGAYAKLILEGDVHTANQHAAGLPTRGNAKTFIYGFLYGAGDEKIGSIVGKDAIEGKRLKNKFLKNTPALKILREKVGEKAKNDGKIRTIDGRYIPIRAAHAALNTLLQSCGAVICKMWVNKTHEKLTQAGFTHGVEYKQLTFCHDELQISYDTNKLSGEVLGKISSEAIKEVGEQLKFRLPLDIDWKIGNNYGETH